MVEFLRGWRIEVDALVPVPPSNTSRKSQPVLEISRRISKEIGVLLCEACVTKVKSTGELKNVFEYKKRAAVLKDAFAVNRSLTEGKRLLLFDDLYRSGATATAVARALVSDGAALAVFLLTLTRTRSKL